MARATEGDFADEETEHPWRMIGDLRAALRARGLV
jgi:hypothetical protein